MGFSVDYGQLSMAGELLLRQQDHANAIEDYVSVNCSIERGDLGLVLQVLHPVNELVVGLATTAVHELGSLAAWGSRTITGTLDTYVTADQEAHGELAALLAPLGATLPPFPDPRGSLPTLGSPTGSAGSGYGSEPYEWNPLADGIVTAVDTAASGVQLVTGTVGTAVDRISSLGSAGGVVERSDPSSYLVTPEAPSENFMEDLRWNAGLLLGGIDWVAEQFVGVSILKEYVLKPLGGDWQAIGSASDAWSHSGQALLETGGNFTGLPGQVDSWTGSASASFQAALAALGAASVGLSYAFDAVSGFVGTVGSVAKIACSGIASALQWISNKLLRLAAEAAVPVIGWAVGAFEVVETVQKIMKYLRWINALITMILDAIADLIEARAKLVQVGFMIEDLVSNAATRAVRA